MKKATLYELKATIVGVEYDTLVKRVIPQFDLKKYRRAGDNVVIPVQERELPIERISRIEHGEQKDHYIALDDDLREILEAPFVTKMETLERHYSTVIGKYREKIAKYQDRISAFNALPWYKRWFSRP